MIDTAKVQLWLRGHLLELPAGLPSLIEYENKTTTGRPDVTYLRETFLPAAEQLVGFGIMQCLGVYQVSVFSPLNTGLEAVRLADKIKDWYSPGMPGGVRGGIGGFIAIERAERGPGLSESLWYQVPVTIYWRVGPRLASAATPTPVWYHSGDGVSQGASTTVGVSGP